MPPAVDGFVAGVPDGWIGAGSAAGAHVAGTDTVVRRSPGRSATVRATSAVAGRSFTLVQRLRADAYAGRRVRLAGWVRVRDADQGGGQGGALWLRVEGGGASLAYDGMADRAVGGTAEWREVAVVLDVPAQAAGLQVGAQLAGRGQAWFDDLRLEVVGPEVPVTAPSRTVPADSLAEAAQRAQYARVPDAARNLDFEGLPPVRLDPAAVAWLREALVPVASAAPGGPTGDLAPLGAMVGEARVVGLGEGTHGTREFFQMKHRVLEYLVRERGFTAFAIEATWPEANAIDEYVRTGRGDPEVLLSHLYFWTWNTREVLDMIRWMRSHNEGVPAARQVRFFGFDMQSPGTAIDTVAAYVRRVDPARADAVDAGYACLAPYRNHGPRGATTSYASAPPAVRQACATSVGAVHALLDSARPRYEAAPAGGGPAAYARALRSARVVAQWEDAASRAGVAYSLRRDAYMAENALWLLDQLPAGARMVLWAHNYHVSGIPGAMGAHLRRALGHAYVNAGFAFGGGAFNAREQSSQGAIGTLRAHETSALAPGSVEAYLAAAGATRAILDARRLEGAAATAPLRGPLPMRSIGAAFEAGQDLSYFTPTALPADFDLLLYFATTTASTLLPFRYE